MQEGYRKPQKGDYSYGNWEMIWKWPQTCGSDGEQEIGEGTYCAPTRQPLKRKFDELHLDFGMNMTTLFNIFLQKLLYAKETIHITFIIL